MWVKIVKGTGPRFLYPQEDILYMEFTPMYRNGTPELNIDGSWNWGAADWLSFEEDENLLSIVNRTFKTCFQHPDDPSSPYFSGRKYD